MPCFLKRTILVDNQRIHAAMHLCMHLCACRDFILQVVGSRVVVSGNSIGGFISASLAADWPGLVSGLVLVNSAGEQLVKAV